MASQKTIDVLNYLKGQSTPLSYKEIATALRYEQVVSVIGVVNALDKKGFVDKTEETDEAGKSTKKVMLNDMGRSANLELDAPKAEGEISEKGRNVINVLKQNAGVKMTAADVAAVLGVQAIAVNGAANALVKKGFMMREEDTVSFEDGSSKTVKYLVLTDAGLNA